MQTQSEVSVPNRKIKRTHDFCAEYGVTPITIWRWVKSGRLPKPLKLNGRNVWPSDVEPKFDSQ